MEKKREFKSFNQQALIYDKYNLLSETDIEIGIKKYQSKNAYKILKVLLVRNANVTE